MSSSERILRSGSSGRRIDPAGPGSEPTADVEGRAVLRGRRTAGGAVPPADDEPRGAPGASAAGHPGHPHGASGASGTSGTSGTSGPRRAGARHSASLAIDLQQAQRIAEERGYAAGLERARRELSVAIEAAGALAARIETNAPHDTAALGHTIAELGLAIARRIIGSELRTDPAILVHSVEAAVATINGSPEARVFLHPDAVESVRAAWELAHGTAYLGKRWTFDPDPALEPGGCILRYDHGFVEAGVDAQLEEIGLALDAAIPGLWNDPSLPDAGHGAAA